MPDSPLPNVHKSIYIRYRLRSSTYGYVTLRESMGSIRGPRALCLDEFKSLHRLQDTVFRPGPNTSMFDEFPTLFSPENRERLRVISVDGEIVSAICYQIRPAIIYGVTLAVASLGAVCTYESYRGHGFATQLLDDTFAAARKEGADVMLISGQRG
ncbi:MAG TPA: GNAT family N-acetyltransferase, partial [Firmicutes bacterium]|nr:GNAT family N-acetyltransferase [Bacillota bacterium]